MSATVDIVVVNWNSGRQLLECVESVLSYGGSAVSRVVVVDNGSHDGSTELVEGLPLVVIIRAGSNLGFAKACNLGATDSRARYLLFLNPDARLLESTLARVLAFMESNEGAPFGICGVRLLDEDGKVQRHCAPFPSWKTSFGISTGLGRVFPRTFPGLLLENFDHLSSCRVDHVMGAFFFLRAEVFASLGGFDERYFVYLEDLDFSLRASERGWPSYYFADAAAFHRGGGTSSQVKARRLFYVLRSRIVYGFRHFSRSAAWGTVGLTLLVEPWPRLGRALLRGSWKEASDTLRAFAMLWGELPSTLRIGMSRG